MAANPIADSRAAGGENRADVGRRTVMAGLAATGALAMAVSRPATAAPSGTRLAIGGGHVIRPRSEWIDTDPAPMATEVEVAVILVHHTASSNSYAETDVPAILRSIHAFHSGPEKGWPDIAYNFMVDRFGHIWEARAGSITRPIAGSATGGNQGSSQLCCFLGTHTDSPPTDAAKDAMSHLVVHIAHREGLTVGETARSEFVSAGSNRHPAGTVISTNTITGHRDMSQTTCPGDAAMSWVAGTLRPLAATLTATLDAPSSTRPPDDPLSSAPTSVDSPQLGTPQEGGTGSIGGTAPAPSTSGDPAVTNSTPTTAMPSDTTTPIATAAPTTTSPPASTPTTAESARVPSTSGSSASTTATAPSSSSRAGATSSASSSGPSFTTANQERAAGSSPGAGRVPDPARGGGNGTAGWVLGGGATLMAALVALRRRRSAPASGAPFVGEIQDPDEEPHPDGAD